MSRVRCVLLRNCIFAMFPGVVVIPLRQSRVLIGWGDWYHTLLFFSGTAVSSAPAAYWNACRHGGSLCISLWETAFVLSIMSVTALPPPPSCNIPPLAIPPPPGGEWSVGPKSIEDTRRQRKFLQGAERAEADLHCDAMVQFCGAIPPPPQGNGAERRRYYCNALPASHTLVS